MGLFNERVAIPESITYSVETLPTGFKLGRETKRAGKKGLVRELEVAVIMSIDTARQIHSWLGKQLAGAERSASTRLSRQPHPRLTRSRCLQQLHCVQHRRRRSTA